ncbi:MAG: DUF2490 domain-containing protein [Myxococcota bacterium]|nr:DUF2490 domain-containing protein [Myxococcota bacterium]
MISRRRSRREVLASSALALVLATAAAMPARASAQAYEASYQTWTSLTVQGNVTPDLALYVDLNWRFYDDFHPYQQLYRPGLGYRIAPGMYVWLAYAWTPSWNDARQFVDEHRIWEQWSYDVPGLPSGIRWYSRVRLEQRFRPELSSDVALRLRFMSRVLVPFAPDLPLHLSLWDEAFVPVTNAGQSAGGLWQRIGFDQNRLFVGVGWNVVPPQVRIELGYLNHWIVSHAGTDVVHHAVALNAFVTVP